MLALESIPLYDNGMTRKARTKRGVGRENILFCPRCLTIKIEEEAKCCNKPMRNIGWMETGGE